MVPLIAASGGHALWYATRGTGVVSLLLLTTSMVLGAVVTARVDGPRWPRWILEGLHRNLSLVGVAFIAVHVATTVIDGYAPVGWLDAVVPFGSSYHPLWTGLGAVALDLMIAVAVTSLVRSRIGYRAWRLVHWAAYGCWPIAVVHGIGMGTDAGRPWMIGLDVAAVVAVGAAVWWRARRTARFPVVGRQAGVVPVAARHGGTTGTRPAVRR